MRYLILLLFPCVLHSQPVMTLAYKTKEVHNITVINDTTWNWKVDTIKYSLPFEIKCTTKSIAIDGYSSYKITAYKDKSHEGTRIDYWELSNGTNISMFDKGLMYWNYPVVKGKTKIIYFKIE